MSKVPARGPMRSGARLRLKQSEVSPQTHEPESSSTALKLKRRELSIALISVIVTLAVALISTATAFGVSTLTNRGQQSQAAVDFRRNHQQETYSAFITSANGANAAIGAFRHQVVVAASENKSDGEMTKVKMDAGWVVSQAIDELRANQSMVNLVGSEGTKNAASEVVRTTDSAFSAAASELGKIVTRNGTVTYPGYGSDGFLGREGEALGAIQIFVANAREDLEAYGSTGGPRD